MPDIYKTAICSINSKYVHSSLAPWYLLSGIKAYCPENVHAEVFEGTINEQTGDIAARIAAFSPDIVGLSCYIWNITKVKELTKLIKRRLPKVMIVLGGPEVSYNAGTVLSENPEVDYIISGEGEAPFAMLINCLSEGNTPYNIPGICMRSGKEMLISSPFSSDDEALDPYPDEYFESLRGRIAYIETSRGCPYSCAFCLSGRCGKPKLFDIEKAKDDILRLSNSGTKTIKFVDRTFNSDRLRSFELVKFILDNYGKKIPSGVCFHFEIAGDILTDDLISLFASAPNGSIQLEIGLQSFNEKTLRSINRKTDTEALRRNVLKLAKNANIHIHIDLIAGLPYEDLKSFKDSFNMAFSLRPNMLQLGFLKLLYGSPMRENPERFPCSFSPFPPYEVLETPWLSAGDLSLLHCAEDALDRIYNSGRFTLVLEYLLNKYASPFDLFCKFGTFAAKYVKSGISLNDYTELMFNYFSGQAVVDKSLLRDKIVCDRLASDPSGILPAFLQVKDPLLKKVKILLESDPVLQRKKSVKRGIALLYSEASAVYCDYDSADPVTGRYEIKKYPYSNI